MSVLHASTSLLRSPSQFRQLVKKVKEVSHDNLLLFSLSHNSPDLENSVKELSSAARETIGCLSAPLPLRDRNPFFSCSVAVFPKEICVPFSVDKAGLPPTQIGRWHSYAGGKPVDDGIAANDDVGVWGETWGMNDSTQFLPDELRGTSLDTFIYFSDNSASELASSIHSSFKGPYQLGMIGSSTPFVTGHPFSLFRNGKLQPSGAAGFGLNLRPNLSINSSNGLSKLTEAFEVTRAEGNLIHEVKNGLPARLLVDAMKKLKLPDNEAKNIDFYIGIQDSIKGKGNPESYYKIIAGSPSRGSIAVEDFVAPAAGTLIELYFRSQSWPTRLDEKLTQPRSPSEVVIGSIVNNMYEYDLSLGVEAGLHKSADDHEELANSFISASEHGFHLNRDYNHWKCTVPSFFAGLQFNK